MPKYMICAISAIEDFETLDEAIAAAQKHTEAYGKESGGFAIFETKEVGQVQYVSPMWVPTNNFQPTLPVIKPMGLERNMDNN